MVEEDESEETKRQQQRASNYSEDSVAEEAAEDYKREMVVQFESGGSMKIGKPVEEATVARKAEEHVTSEHTSNAGESRIELISYRSIEKILDDAEEEMEVEMQKKEETSDIHLDTIIIKSR